MGYGRVLWARQAPCIRASEQHGLDNALDILGDAILDLCTYGRYDSSNEVTSLPLFDEPLVVGSAGSYHSSVRQDFYWSGRMLCPRIQNETNPCTVPVESPDKVIAFWVYADALSCEAVDTRELAANLRVLFFTDKDFMPIGNHMNGLSKTLVFDSRQYQDFVWSGNRLCLPDQLVR